MDARCVIRESTGLPPISAVVLTRDEEAHIVPCLRTLRWAAEVLVVDSGSTDSTRQRAAAMGARVLQREWDGWATQRNFALGAAACPWVIFVDADERVPLELAEEVQARVAAATAAAATGQKDAPIGFWVPRQNLILGRWMKYAGWYPDYQLRVFLRTRGHYDPDRPVHEIVLLDGASDYLRRALVHHNYATWRQFWAKQRRYARAEAQALAVHSVRAKPHHLIVQPLREFRRRYWTLEGYRAGRLGLALSAVLAAANCFMYLELWRQGRAQRRTQGRPQGRAQGRPMRWRR